METQIKLPVWFWVISAVALLWNLMGVNAYISQAYSTPEALAALSEGEQNYFANSPSWVTAAFAIAVFAGALGCIALLFRKKWAIYLLIISLIAVIAQATYNFFIQDYISLSGSRIVMPIMIIIVAFLLVSFSKTSERKGWIS